MSPSTSRRRLARILPLALLIAVPVACRDLPENRGQDVETLIEGKRLAEVNPSDIAVLPVANFTDRTDLPLDQLRRAFYEGLVRRRYSPLALDYVDARAIEAGYTPGQFDEEAAMSIAIRGWDDSQWDRRSLLQLDVEVYILSGDRGAMGGPLWGGSRAMTLNLSRDRGRAVGEADLMDLALRHFTEDVLGALPRRDPLQGD